MTSPDPATRFATLRDQWERDTAILSNLTQIVAHPAYREIVSMGRDAVPLIIGELRRDPHHWFSALAEIVGADHAAGATTLDEAARRWIAWYDGGQS